MAYPPMALIKLYLTISPYFLKKVVCLLKFVYCKKNVTKSKKVQIFSNIYKVN